VSACHLERTSSAPNPDQQEPSVPLLPGGKGRDAARPSSRYEATRSLEFPLLRNQQPYSGCLDSLGRVEAASWRGYVVGDRYEEQGAGAVPARVDVPPIYGPLNHRAPGAHKVLEVMQPVAGTGLGPPGIRPDRRRASCCRSDVEAPGRGPLGRNPGGACRFYSSDPAWPDHLRPRSTRGSAICAALRAPPPPEASNRPRGSTRRQRVPRASHRRQPWPGQATIALGRGTPRKSMDPRPDGQTDGGTCPWARAGPNATGVKGHGPPGNGRTR